MAKNNNDDSILSEDKKHDQAIKASDSEEESLIGDNTDLEADDDTLENAHDMGLYKADDGEHPQELNLAAEVMTAEEKRRGLV